MQSRLLSTDSPLRADVNIIHRPQRLEQVLHLSAVLFLLVLVEIGRSDVVVWSLFGVEV